MALQQALTNAIVHGNLELTTDQIHDSRESLMTGKGQGIVAERRAESPYRDRRVFVDIRINREEARIVIRDQGPGFDVSQFRQDAANDAELKRGRGLRLMRMFMDEVAYNERGNEVTLARLWGKK
jgi:anti-sigma regulatory factor (Ser/Thr protein kinase)